MTILESLLYSLFGFSIVFVALISLIVVVKIITSLVSKLITGKTVKMPISQAEETANNTDSEEVTQQMLAGELKLIGVDEKTAAMIMAIVSDDSAIPLSELRFKTIKAMD